MTIFDIEAKDGDARAGMLHTAHGDLRTPAFMPVATQGSVKAVDPRDLRAMGAGMVLGNTYHLYLRPGVKVIERLGGLHRFMGWEDPILTDSGGFQGFSLRHLRKITQDAIVFKSHVDGSIHTFTPEATVEHQQGLGADVIMPLDVCPPSTDGRQSLEAAVDQTTRWAERSKVAHTESGQMLFGIVQGGLDPVLRERSATDITSIGFPGYAIGGLSVGESKTDMHRVAGLTARLLPEASPRYLMGVGSPEDLVECVARGVDMFDCVLPTRIARNGALLVGTGRLNIDTAPFRTLEQPIEPCCDCYTCANFSAAYLHHLFRAKEVLAFRLATIHNLRFVIRLMSDMRQAIVDGEFEAFRASFHRRFVPPDEATRRGQKQKWLDSRERSRAPIPQARR